MMEVLRSWISSLVAITLLISLLQALLPDGGVRRVASLVSGLILLAVLLRPALDLNALNVRLDWEAKREALLEQQKAWEQDTTSALTERIAEQTEAYISDKAAEMGLDAESYVEVFCREDGVLIPSRVELSIPYSEPLSTCIKQDLGIPAERQVWNEGKT